MGGGERRQSLVDAVGVPGGSEKLRAQSIGRFEDLNTKIVFGGGHLRRKRQNFWG